MSTAAATNGAAFGPWNPGIASDLPAGLLPLSTVLRPENVYTGIAEAQELRAFTGLQVEELVAFRPQRLVVHELLVRVTADLSVPDGPRQEDLGISFRGMAHTIYTKHLLPHMAEIEREYAAVKARIAALVDSELAGPQADPPPRARGLAALFALGRRERPPQPHEDAWAREQRLLSHWARTEENTEDPVVRAACAALAKVVSSFRIRHPRARLDPALLGPIATTLAVNECASAALGRLIDPWVRAAARTEGYRVLPPQSRPVVMNTKGASAAGKSTMRPLQKRLAGEIGVDWADFALISPDIWRKYLLDYETLGEAYKYAGTFTGLEMEVVHYKLDRYMAEKAERGEMTHLLIDRFRFDSFAPDSDEAGSNLLTRFGHLVYLFFMITPPHATVERAWKRGLEVGRYKAVDDLLAHNVEAYSGMPELFFTWALRKGKRVHYEFLDNSVPQGERPRTIAFGWNGEMNVLDVKCMLDVDRYRKIDVNARSPEAVYPDMNRMAPERNVEFLGQCARRLPTVNFVEHDTGRVYLRLAAGKVTLTDPRALSRALADPETRAGIAAVAPDALPAARADAPEQPAEYLEAGDFHTLGAWKDKETGERSKE